MSSKKKSKANKLARMSEDEKLRYLQHRTAMEEEAQRRKHRLISTYLKNKAKHEEAFSRLNLAKINQQWRYVLRQMKCKDLQDNMGALKQKFEVVLECKDKIIHNLLSDFDAAEIQYSTQFQNHIEIISKFTRMHQIRLTDLYKWYIQNLEIAVRMVDEEKCAMVTELDKDISTLQDLNSNMENQCETKLQRMFLQCTEDEDRLCKRLLNTVHRLEQNFHRKLFDLQKDYQQIFQDHKNKTESKMSSYIKLREDDRQDLLEIHQQNQLIQNYCGKISELKKECAELEKKNTAEEDILNVRHNDLLKQFQCLSRHVEDEKSSERDQLKVLSSASSSVIKELMYVLKKGDQLQQIVRSCDKMIEDRNEACEESFDDSKTVNTQIFPPFDKLEHFWRKYNEIGLNNEALLQQKKIAEAENAELKRKLRRYLKSIRRPCSVPRKCGF